MTTQLPRPIEPGGARIGDTIRAEITDGVYVHRYEGVVAARMGDTIHIGRNTADDTEAINEREWALTLLAEAPTPAPKSWREQLADEIRKWADGYHDVPGYWRGHIAGLRQAASFIENSRFGESIPDIPDHGDGCSEWLWDKQTGTAWVAVPHHLSQGVTHQQVCGEKERSGYLVANSEDDRDFAARLRPWGEQGQVK